MNLCDYCGQQVNKTSVDVMVSRTSYNDWHDVAQTMEDVTDIGINADYVIICERPACQQHFRQCWNTFVAQMGTETRR